ncbi:DUF6879 family protein [Actinomadura atramentaria]|uniref:DUF6879 family protein n=1 Tax=Actinomadura atramentaria TaxID=1990 RepID=UPI00036DB8E5|nr:DUF6879 family protein [Actinomadura atramentaria]
MPEVSFEDLLGSARIDAVKFELRDEYMTSDPAYQGWLAGESAEKVSTGYSDWTALARATAARGVAIRRVRIVAEPVSDYVKFEHAVTPAVNLAGGEDIRWLPRSHTEGLLVPATDVWVVDGRTVLFLFFSGDGDFVGSRTATGEGVAAPIFEAFTAAWKRAVPHHEFTI